MALIASVSLLAAACGGDDDEPGGSSGAADVDPTGVLRLGSTLGDTTGGITFDLTTQVLVPPMWYPMIFDTLLRRTSDGGSEPGLAKEATIVDPSTLTVELHPGITFSDGSPLDAEAVKFGIERNINQGKQGSFEVELYQLQSITVDSPTELTIKLKTPIAGAWYRLLSLPETSPVSVVAARAGNNFNQNPIGAGPFKLESFENQNHLKLVKNPDFFQADTIRLGGIEFVYVSATAISNALRSRTVDMQSSLPYSLVQGLEGSGVHVQTKVSDNSSLIGHICKSRPPFDDLRVRQAINYAIDRESLNALFDGQGEPMWGFFAEDSPWHVDGLDDYYERDLAKARKLLADAGQSNLTFDVFVSPGLDGQRAGEVLQQQLAEAGVTIKLNTLTTQTDFFPDATKAPMYFFPLSRAGLNKITRVYVPGSYGNVCTWNDPVLNELVADLQAVQEDSAEGIRLWKEIQEHAFETAVSIFGLFTVQSNAWFEDRVGDVDFLFIATAPVPDFYRMYIKK
ncbi:MAG: ABC transporter substrate-binding protein [Acidimicrobiia bacterium]